MMIGTVGDKWIIGLCFENLDRLRNGEPIHVRPEVHKTPFEILIHAEPSMGDLQALGERLAGDGLPTKTMRPSGREDSEAEGRPSIENTSEPVQGGRVKVDTKKLLELCEKVCKSQTIGNVHEFYEAAKPDVVKSLCTELDRARELLEKVAEIGQTYEIDKEICEFLQDDKRGGV